MTSLALSFNDVKFNPVSQSDAQIWLTSSELANALGYSSVKSVTNLYNANKDEFTSSMTLVTESMTNAKVEVTDSVTSKRVRNLTKKTRIFSLRGCHLLAMFARTTVAKEFRKWVLDVLDQEVGRYTSVQDREPLNKAIVMLVAASGRLNYSDAYKLVHQRFGVDHTHELTPLQLNEAIEYVHRLISGNAPMANDTYELIRKFTESTLSQNFILRNVWEAIRLISPQDAAYYNRYIADTNQLARKVSVALNFRNKQNQPLISQDGSVIHFQSGVMFTGINPKWFSMRN